MSRKKRKMTILLVIFIIYTIPGLDQRVRTTEFEIDSSKVDKKIKLALVTDLHSCDYGEKAERLMSQIHSMEPDVVVMSGDIIDDRLPMEHAITFLEVVSKEYPCYYVSGNHEIWSGRINEIKKLIESYGIKVLEGNVEQVMINGQKIEIAGIDDYDIGDSKWDNQVEKVSHKNSDTYRVFLTHRPYIEGYKEEAYYDKEVFDLVLTGHVHGAQWRFPGMIDGLLAPNQGFLPKYVGGIYELKHTKMILSRGLAKESTRIFRFYNRPEVVGISIK